MESDSVRVGSRGSASAVLEQKKYGVRRLIAGGLRSVVAAAASLNRREQQESLAKQQLKRSSSAVAATTERSPPVQLAAHGNFAPAALNPEGWSRKWPIFRIARERALLVGGERPADQTLFVIGQRQRQSVVTGLIRHFFPSFL